MHARRACWIHLLSRRKFWNFVLPHQVSTFVCRGEDDEMSTAPALIALV